eukprot:479640_1
MGQLSIFNMMNILKLWRSSNYSRFVIMALLYIMVRKIFITFHRKYYSLPPGPTGMTLFGSLLSFILSPRKFLINNCKYGPISCFYFGSKLIISINDGCIGHEILKSASSILINRPDNNLLDSIPYKYIAGVNGIQWLKRRKLGMSHFVNIAKSDFILHRMEYAVNDCVAPEIDICIKNNKLFYPHKYSFYLGFNSIYSAIFGGNIDNKNPNIKIWREHIEKMLISFIPVFMLQLFNINFIPPKLFWKFSSFQQNMKIIEDDIEDFMINDAGFELNEDNLWERRTTCSQPVNSDSIFIDVAISYQYEEKWYDKQMLLNDVATYFFSGASTTSNVVEYGFLLLAKFSDVQEEIYDEVMNVLHKNNLKEFTFSIVNQLHKLKAFIHEVIRISNVAPLGLYHVIDEDMQYKVDNQNTYILPKNSFLILNHIAIHKYAWNNTQYPDDKINLKYWLDCNGKFKMSSQFIGFGSGKRD